jgi:O-antigen/teichoic acid export membrane protein
MTERLRVLFQRKFVRDTVALQIGKAASAVIIFATSVLVARLLGPSTYGVWTLVQSFYSIWQTPNLTGLGPSTNTRLALAVGAKNETEILNQMGYYVRVAVMWGVFNTTAMALLGPPIAATLYESGARVGWLAVLYSLNLIPDALFNLSVIALQSKRLMRQVAALQMINTLVLAGCMVTALLINPILETIIASRLVYSSVTMLIALVVYLRARNEGLVVYPSLRSVFGHARTVPIRPYLRFGVANAIDKNLSNLFVQIPVQLVGILGGNIEAGYVGLVMRGINLPSTFTSAVLDNMQAVVPLAVGRGNYTGLQRNFKRALGILSLLAVGFYTVFAIGAVLLGPILIPLLYKEQWIPVIPLIPVVGIYGAINTVGGNFGPLYRALNLLRRAISVKLITLIVVVPVGIVLVAQQGALGGVWMVNLLFAVSVALTAIVTLPVLNRKAENAETRVADTAAVQGQL